MEGKINQIPTAVDVNGDDVTTLALPEGAIARLGRGDVNDIAFSPNRQYLTVATDIGIWLYTLPTLSAVALWDTENGHTDVVTFSPDSRWIATYSNNERTLKIWDVQTGVCIAQMEDSYQPNNCRPIFSQDCKYLFDRSLQWYVQTGELYDEIELWHPHPTNAADSFTFSSDGTLVIAERSDFNNDNTEMVVWDVASGEQIACLSETSERHDFVWLNPCFSPCGRYLAIGDSQGKIRVWELKSGNLAKTYSDFGDAKLYPCYTSMGNLIAAGILSQKVEVWDVEKHDKIDEFGIDGEYVARHRVRFSDDGTQLAVSIPNELSIWTKETDGSHTLTILNGHTDTADCLAYSSDGKTLATGYWGANVILWDVASKCAHRRGGEKLRGTAHAVYLSANGQFISIGGEDKDTLWISEIGKPEPLAVFNEPWLGVRQSSAYALTAERLARVDDVFNIHVWQFTHSTESGITEKYWRKHTMLTGHTAYIRGLAFSPDGNQLVSIASSINDPTSHNVRLWDVNTGKQISELSLPPFSSSADMYRICDLGIAFSPCGNLIAGGQSGEIVLWSAKTRQIHMRLPQPKDSQRPITLCFSPCGKYLASGAWWQTGLKLVSIRLWEISSKRNIATFWSHTTDVQDLQFSPDGTCLASAGHDGVIYLWDVTPYI